MKFGLILLYLLCFVAGVGVVLVGFFDDPVPAASAPWRGGRALTAGLAEPSTAGDFRPAASWKGQGESGDFPVSAEMLALAGLSAPPVMEDVFSAGGLDRYLRMALFLQNATTGDLKAMADRCREEDIQDPNFTEGIWLRWVEIDREDALRQPAFMAVFRAWAALDPEAAVRAAAGESRASLTAAIAAIGRGDHTAAVALLKQYPEVDVRSVWEGILEDWGKTDPAGASAMALEKGTGLKETVESWTLRDPAAALAWARQLKNPVQRRQVLEMALGQRIQTDPAAALKETGTLPPGRMRTELTANALAALARTDAPAAVAAARALPEPAERVRALAGLSASLAASDPAAALTLYQELATTNFAGAAAPPWSLQEGNVRISDHRNQENPRLPALRQLMAAAPEQTAEALASLPDAGREPFQYVMQEWARSEPEAASRWLARQPDGPVRDKAVAGLSWWLTHDTPEPDYTSAIIWSLSASPEARTEPLLNIFRHWNGSDPAAAHAALDSQPFTPEQRGAILGVLKK